MFNIFSIIYFSLIWQLFVIFVIGHLIANYLCVKSVVMNTFNQNRFHLLVENFFNTNVILTPKVVNKLEPVLSTVKRTLSVNLGCPLTNLTNLNNPQLIRFTNDGFYIKFDIKSMFHKEWNFYV